MQFAGAFPKQLYFFRVNAANQLIQQRTRGRAFILKIGFALEYSVVIATDRVDSACPNVPFIWSGALQQADDSRFCFSPAIFIPKNTDDLQIMLEAYLLDKAVYEIGYELNHRPAWVVIPIRGIKHILQSA